MQEICVPSFGWLCWGLTSQSTIFQSCRDGAIASWVINQYFRGVKCLAQGHNTAEVGLEPRTSRSGVRHSTTEPPRSPFLPFLLFSYACTSIRIELYIPFSLFHDFTTCGFTFANILHEFKICEPLNSQMLLVLVTKTMFMRLKKVSFQYWLTNRRKTVLLSGSLLLGGGSESVAGSVGSKAEAFILSVK